MNSKVISPVTSQVLAECLSYTLSARLAPEWNRVGGWLLQGEKFLHHTEPLNAVKMKVNVANESVEVSVKATRVSSHQARGPGDQSGRPSSRLTTAAY